MKVIKRTAKGEQQEAFYVQARWRADLPLGLVIENRNGTIVVTQVQPGSIANQFFQYGDVLEKGKR
ncbi:unnamed protein product [Meloidogyne enterolobii]|uniref:Uncharacterized protein n=1 Tax=Meloidogyne enterolobii TaxID=390850 RepID=A0ACB0YNJ8_MELEN